MVACKSQTIWISSQPCPRCLPSGCGLSNTKTHQNCVAHPQRKQEPGDCSTLKQCRVVISPPRCPEMYYSQGQVSWLTYSSRWHLHTTEPRWRFTHFAFHTLDFKEYINDRRTLHGKVNVIFQYKGVAEDPTQMATALLWDAVVPLCSLPSHFTSERTTWASKIAKGVDPWLDLTRSPGYLWCG